MQDSKFFFLQYYACGVLGLSTSSSKTELRFSSSKNIMHYKFLKSFHHKIFSFPVELRKERQSKGCWIC